MHEYGHIDDRLVYDLLKNNMEDFDSIRKEIIAALKLFRMAGNPTALDERQALFPDPTVDVEVGVPPGENTFRLLADFPAKIERVT